MKRARQIPGSMLLFVSGCIAAAPLWASDALAAPQAQPDAAAPPPAGVAGPQTTAPTAPVDTAAPALPGEAAPPATSTQAPAPTAPPAATTPAATTPATTPAPVDPKEVATILKGLLPEIHFGTRIGGTLQGEPRNKLDRFQLDTVYVEPRVSGKITDWLSWQANFNAVVTSYSAAEVHVTDLVAQFAFHEAFNVWVGHFTVPSDRSNSAGPYYMSPWIYPGTYGGVFLVGPITGEYGRDTGATIWGNLLDNKITYHLGAFNLENRDSNARFAGRLNIALVGSEPGYFGSSTYYGDQDIVAIGAAFQYQKDGELGPAPTPPEVGPQPVAGDLTVFMADLLAEKKLGDAGVATLEGAYYHFDENYPVKQGYFALASYLLPWTLGVGRLQPLVRWQQAFLQDSDAPSMSVLDADLSYVVSGYNLRFVAGYQRQDLGVGPIGNSLHFGVQLQQ